MRFSTRPKPAYAALPHPAQAKTNTPEQPFPPQTKEPKNLLGSIRRETTGSGSTISWGRTGINRIVNVPQNTLASFCRPLLPAAMRHGGGRAP